MQLKGAGQADGGTGVVCRAETKQDGVTVEAILAGLDHPAIARFIDCGADESGALVPGLRICLWRRGE